MKLAGLMVATAPLALNVLIQVLHDGSPILLMRIGSAPVLSPRTHRGG